MRAIEHHEKGNPLPLTVPVDQIKYYIHLLRSDPNDPNSIHHTRNPPPSVATLLEIRKVAESLISLQKALRDEREKSIAQGQRPALNPHGVVPVKTGLADLTSASPPTMTRSGTLDPRLQHSHLVVQQPNIQQQALVISN